MADLLPVLVVDLVEESVRDFLEQVARDNEEAWVPLVTAPLDDSRHVLEIYSPAHAEPLRVIAVPTGPATKHGFPLRLSLLTDAEGLPESLSVPTVEHVAVGLDVTIASDEDEDEPTVPPPPPPPPRDSLLGRSLAGGKLLIESLIGSGMMGAVYMALHRELRIHVAVKVLHENYQQDADFCRRFYDEALAASRLDHPNLVRVYDFGQEPDGLLYLSMELVAGRSLRTALAEEGPLSSTRIAEIMMQVCAGLGQAHTRGIVHRDVKPDNIVLVMRQDDDGRTFEQVKVCDFGLALLRASDGVNERFAGTPVYMSPEQCRGDDLDARTDLYACGIMMFELATGTVPFLSDKPIVVINRHLTMQPPPLASLRPDVDPRLEPIVQKALMKVRDERYATVRELRADLKVLLTPPAPQATSFDLAHAASQVEAAPTSAASPDAPPVSVRGRRAPSLAPSPDAPPVSVRGRRAPSLAPRAPSLAPRARQPSSPTLFDLPPPDPPPSSPVVSSPAPPAAPSTPAWLEDAQAGYSSFLHEMASGEKRAAEVSVSLARDPKAWLTKLLAERDPRLIDKMLGEVQGAARLVAQRADARTLRALSSTVHGIATDDTRHAAIRASASAVEKVFADPALLAPIAERLLSRDDDHRDAGRALILDAGVAGAYALYGARVKHATESSAREPFIATMRALGESAWPIVRAALERIPGAALTGGHPVAADLAEDLLLCVPSLRDEAAGQLVAKYVRTTQASLCRAATQALGRLMAERAAPLLLALLDLADDGVRSAAIAGLREIGAVDEDVVQRLLPILTRKIETSVELRLESVTALEFVTIGARKVAVPLLVQLVRDKTEGDAAVLAAARALLSVMGNEARAVVIDRSDFAQEPLKSHLLVLLRDPKLPEIDAKDLKDLL